MKKQKHLHIIFIDFDDIKNPLLGAGQARATLEVGKRLVQMGHTVTVICSRYPGYRDRVENGLHYRHIGIGTKNIRLNNLWYIFTLPFAVRNLQADIIVECFTAPISTLLSPLFVKIPVIGVPINATPLNGLDSLLATVQMPSGVPVATVAIGKPGAYNAALFAVQCLALSDTSLAEALDTFKEELVSKVDASPKSFPDKVLSYS